MDYMDYTNLTFQCIGKNTKIAYLDSWEYEDLETYNNELYKDYIKRIDIYKDLKAHCLDEFKILVIPMGVDQLWLLRHKELLAEFLDSGGIVCDFAASFCEYLPNLPFYIQSDMPIKDRELVLSKHCIFKGVRAYDVNYRRGVKGFFNRGFIKPPLEAELILTDSENECVAYIDRTSFKGILLKSAGADLLSFGLFENDTARRMGLNLLIWLDTQLGENV
ncbi:aspartate/tyrosine/aromatic aminotransferase [Campylobacter sp. MIT 12-5580]|uniref:aspartate/tyrosine/aromatic aminotransferase n=1 Tax=Campylobacter sp. MIT 12-5580 TaxID=2040651 RepID=UPI0010F829E0|nr:aspartate/tyrosine/aromatic aminotransferase [Campylobacter sp. MIT 12-5580]TKX28733.1 aspartate/tyrosine/aromatic aminotransferase [Campylobacter sp. MIT 12-5580]